MNLRSGALVLSCLVGLSCAATPSMPPLVAFGEGAMAWRSCPPQWGGGGMECLRAEVPLAEPDGPTTAVLVRRLRPPGESQGQLWALDGGPLFAGDAFFDPAFVAHVHRASLELIVVSHRGSREASRLDCPEQKRPESVDGGRVTGGEWAGCRDHLQQVWGPNLEHISAAGAARDVAYLVEQIPTSGRRLLFGGAYGTLWAQRLLLEGARFDGAWLDSIVDLEGSLERVDAHADAAMTTLLTACASVPACAARFPDEPLAVARRVIAEAGEGSGCGQAEHGWSRRDLQVWAYKLLSSDPASWVALTAGFARAARCTAEDEEALAQALDRTASAAPTSDGPDTGFYTPELNRHVLFRELFRFDVTPAERAALDASALALDGFAAHIADEAQAFGAAYRAPDPVPAVDTDVPIVLWSGALDPLDPPAWAESTAARFPTARLVSVRWAGHSVLRYLGLGPERCGTTVFQQFLRGEPLALGCVEGAPPPDFSADSAAAQAQAQRWFGTTLD